MPDCICGVTLADKKVLVTVICFSTQRSVGLFVFLTCSRDAGLQCRLVLRAFGDGMQPLRTVWFVTFGFATQGSVSTNGPVYNIHQTVEEIPLMSA